MGYSQIEPGAARFHAFIWEKGHLQDLGTLGGDQSVAWSINRQGNVVGEAYTDTQADRAVLWKNGAIRDLGLLPRGSFTSARGINDRGEVVGYGDTFVANRFGYFEVSRAFLWKSGRMRLLDDLDPRTSPEEGSSHAFAINDRSVVVGSAERIRSQPSWPVLWRAGSSHRIRPLVQAEGAAYAVNDAGQVVGQVGSFPTLKAFTWKNGRFQILRSLSDEPGVDSIANGINRGGQIVGSSAGHAVLWSGKQVLDLNDLIPEGSGWVLQSAAAINRTGQIVGSGEHAGETHAFLLTPE